MNPHLNPYKKNRRLPVGLMGCRLPIRPVLPDMTGLLSHGEPELLYMLALWIGGGHIINLGDGASATVFALALEDHGLEGHVTTVDYYSPARRKAKGAERRSLGVRERVTMIRRTTEDARTYIHEPCSLLFIDADHSYDGCRRDVELYSPLVKGYLAFHDTNQDDVARVLHDCVLPKWERLLWINRIQVFRRAR